MMTVELRAGGTDLTERRRSGVSHGPIADIGPRPELTTIERGADGTRIGALVTIDTIATDAGLRRDYPALTAAAAGLATPQIRRVGTIGGNLLQRNRCWYFRHPGTSCLRKGGDGCPARAGNHRLGALFDLGDCVAVHPSTLGAALLVYSARVRTDQRGLIAVADVFGDGSDGRNDHQLRPGDLLTAVHLPPVPPGELGGYVRAISRTYAEWPLAEAVVRLVVDDGRIAVAAIAAGGVAPVPLRLTAVEMALAGRPATTEVFAEAADRAADGANPLPLTGYKARLLTGTVIEALERAAGSAASVAETTG
jgi:xanthine dehydrogenase YagS FAD-binding subunit